MALYFFPLLQQDMKSNSKRCSIPSKAVVKLPTTETHIKTFSELEGVAPKVHKMMKIIAADDEQQARIGMPQYEKMKRYYADKGLQKEVNGPPIIFLRKHWIYIPTNDGSTLFEGRLDKTGRRLQPGTLAAAFEACGVKVIELDPRIRVGDSVGNKLRSFGCSSKEVVACEEKGSQCADIHDCMAKSVLGYMTQLVNILKKERGDVIKASESKDVCRALGGVPKKDMPDFECTWAEELHFGKSAFCNSNQTNCHESQRYNGMKNSRRNKAALQYYIESIHENLEDCYNYKRVLMYSGAIMKGGKDGELKAKLQGVLKFIFTTYLNSDGLLFRFFAGDETRTVGVSFYYMRYVHMLEIPQTDGDDIQARKRAARSCGDMQHDFLSECIPDERHNPGGKHLLCKPSNSIVKTLHYAYPGDRGLQVLSRQATAGTIMTRALAEFSADCKNFTALHLSSNENSILTSVNVKGGAGKTALCLRRRPGGSKVTPVQKTFAIEQRYIKEPYMQILKFMPLTLSELVEKMIRRESSYPTEKLLVDLSAIDNVGQLIQDILFKHFSSESLFNLEFPESDLTRLVFNESKNNMNNRREQIAGIIKSMWTFDITAIQGEDNLLAQGLLESMDKSLSNSNTNVSNGTCAAVSNINNNSNKREKIRACIRLRTWKFARTMMQQLRNFIASSAAMNAAASIVLLKDAFSYLSDVVLLAQQDSDPTFFSRIPILDKLMSLRTQPLVKQSSLYSRLRNFNNNTGGKSATNQPTINSNAARKLADKYVLGSVANSKVNNNAKVRENVLTKMLGLGPQNWKKVKMYLIDYTKHKNSTISAAAKNLVNKIDRASSNRFQKNLNTSKLRDFLNSDGNVPTLGDLMIMASYIILPADKNKGERNSTPALNNNNFGIPNAVTNRSGPVSSSSYNLGGFSLPNINQFGGSVNAKVASKPPSLKPKPPPLKPLGPVGSKMYHGAEVGNEIRRAINMYEKDPLIALKAIQKANPEFLEYMKNMMSDATLQGPAQELYDFLYDDAMLKNKVDSLERKKKQVSQPKPTPPKSKSKRPSPNAQNIPMNVESEIRKAISMYEKDPLKALKAIQNTKKVRPQFLGYMKDMMRNRGVQGPAENVLNALLLSSMNLSKKIKNMEPAKKESESDAKTAKRGRTGSTHVFEMNQTNPFNGPKETGKRGRIDNNTRATKRERAGSTPVFEMKTNPFDGPKETGKRGRIGNNTRDVKRQKQAAFDYSNLLAPTQISNDKVTELIGGFIYDESEKNRINTLSNIVKLDKRSQRKIYDELYNYTSDNNDTIAKNSERLRKILKLNLSGASKINLIKVLAIPLQELNKYNRKKKSKARTAIYTKRSALRILGLDSKASQADIRKKFLITSRKVHPNKNPDPDAKAKFVELSEAYEFLKKQPVSRRKYSAIRNNSRREIKNRSRSRDYNESR